MQGARLLDPDYGVGGEPVVRMDYIEPADVVLRLDEMRGKGSAHFLNFIDEIAVEVMRTEMIPDTIQLDHPTVPIARAREDMDIMATPLERGRKFGHVGGHSPDRVGVQRLP